MPDLPANPVKRRNARLFVFSVVNVVAFWWPLNALSQSPGDVPGGAIPVYVFEPPPAVRISRAAFIKGCPERRGFRAPILSDTHQAWPTAAPDGTAPESIRKAFEIVGRRLAFDRLPLTLAKAIEAAGPDKMPSDAAERADTLRMMGLPIDLLACFDPSNSGASQDESLDAYILRRLRDGDSVERLRDDLNAIPFRFQKSDPGFAVTTEHGLEAVGAIRLQLPSTKWYSGPGDGTAIDVARQLAEAFPSARFLVSIEQSQIEALQEKTADWPPARASHLIMTAEPHRVEQWAQDNGKAGLIETPDGQQVIATLAPRYASVGEEMTKFVPQESFVMDSLAAAGHRVVHSPLIFQGGNLMAVDDPATGQRILLIGEAEICRNTALGLSEAQVLEAFRIEFGVDRCVVLPAVSFHIDFEVTARVIDGRVVAFVNDSRTAARLVLKLGVDALARSGKLSQATAAAIRGHLDSNADARALEILAPVVLRLADSKRQFPESACAGFGVDDCDEPASNFERFLLALDILAAYVTTPQEMPPHRVFGAYIRSFQRREADRQSLIDTLAGLGWRIVRVPSLADETRSLNYINGIQTPEAYLMPAFGGFYSALDDEAARVFAEAMGGEVPVRPIFTAESQRRLGALHCAVAVYPRPSEPADSESSATDAPPAAPSGNTDRHGAGTP